MTPEQVYVHFPYLSFKIELNFLLKGRFILKRDKSMKSYQSPVCQQLKKTEAYLVRTETGSKKT